jgi:HPt (histidine-containing phosphotransfer) domain-containing protein
MAANAQSALSAALDRLWVQYTPLIHERVELLEAAACDLAAGPLSADRRQEAQAAAHKLAGVLGTFGLARGTELARELEVIYSRQTDPEASLAKRLAAITAEIHSIVDSRK